MKFVALVAVPPGVVTVILPVVAPEGTVAVILVEVLTVNVAATPLNLTEEASLKVLPLIVTLVPARPEVGEKLVIWSAGPGRWPRWRRGRPALVTLILPVVAADGTLTVICVGELMVKAVVVALLNVDQAGGVEVGPGDDDGGSGHAAARGEPGDRRREGRR